jgi:hypothetical protein
MRKSAMPKRPNMSESHALKEGKQEQDPQEFGQKQQRESTHRKRRAIRHKPRWRPPPTAALRSPSGPSEGAYEVSGLFSTQTYHLTECIGTSIFVSPSFAAPHTETQL